MPSELAYTMTDYFHAVKQNDLTGIYSFRLTPPNWIEKLPRSEIKFRLELMCKHPFIKRLIAFEEGTDYPSQGSEKLITKKNIKRHYHVRMETDFKTPKSVRDLVLKSFPIPERDGKKHQSQYYSIHSCKEKDKTFWKGETYIAKEGHLVHNYNYSEQRVAQIIYWGRKIQSFAGKTIAERITILLDLDNKTTLHQAYDATILYYKEEKHQIPDVNTIKRVVHQILFRLNNSYREEVRQLVISDFQLKYDSLMRDQYS